MEVEAVTHSLSGTHLTQKRAPKSPISCLSWCVTESGVIPLLLVLQRKATEHDSVLCGVLDLRSICMRIFNWARYACDKFDEHHCETGMDISKEGSCLTKTGGADLTSTFGTVEVKRSWHRWDVRVDCSMGNTMIGVAPRSMKLSYIDKVWNTKSENTLHDGQW